MATNVVFIIDHSSVKGSVQVLIDKSLILDLQEVEGKTEEYTAQIKSTLSTFGSLQNVFLEVKVPSRSLQFKKIFNLKEGSFFKVTEHDQKLQVQQARDKKKFDVQQSNSSFSIKPSSSKPVKKWAPVETSKKAPVDRSKIVKATPSSQSSLSSSVLMPSSDQQEQTPTKVHFYFGHVIHHENGEIEPITIKVNDIEKLSSVSEINGHVVEIEVPPARSGFEHRIALTLEGPHETKFSKRINLTEKGYHILVKRPSKEELTIDQAESGNQFAKIVAEEKIKIEKEEQQSDKQGKE